MRHPILTSLLLSVSVQVIALAEEIPVVVTWSELASSPVTASGDFGRAFVGLEATRAPVGSGVLVYCLVEREADSSTRQRFTHQHVLGPLDCRIQHAGSPRERMAEMLAVAESLPKDAGAALYTRLVMIDRAGEFTVSVVDPASKQTLGAAIVMGTSEPYHTWVPLSPGNPTEPELSRRENEYVAFLSSRHRGPALPAHDGMTPIAWQSDRGDRSEPLPKLVPSEPSPALTLRKTNGDLIIQSTSDMIVSHTQCYFLARWWINGKPFLAETVARPMNLTGMVITGRRLRVPLEFDAADIGAKSGDEIGLQLLHVPHGWQPIDLSEVAVVADGPGVSRLTNPISFLAPYVDVAQP